MFCNPEFENRWKKFLDENEPWLLIGIPSNDSFLKIQCMEQHFVRTDLNVKELMPLRESLHEMMQCDMRQHFALRWWLHETSRKTFIVEKSTRMNFMNKPSGCSKMRSESSWRINTALERYFEERAQETWRRNL